MDIFALLFLSCICILLGIIITLVAQYYLFLKYLKINSKSVSQDSGEENTKQEPFQLPEELQEQLENEALPDGFNCGLPITLLFQFLFYELRHSDAIKRWFYKKLSLEFDELVTKTTTGKFFDAVTIKDIHLGSQFPILKNIGIDSVKLDKSEGNIETLTLTVDVDYRGNFSLSVNARMKFGKTAYLSIKVKKLCGTIRLQFTRIPYSHWSFSFCRDPLIDLAVQSQFQGRQLQSNITSLIVHQIKKAIKRKHTLPNYKIRYKPFFIKTDPGQVDIDDYEVVSQGNLQIECLEVSRLEVSPDVQKVYTTFAVDTFAWISVYQGDDYFVMLLELTVTKFRQQQLGAAFKLERNLIVIESLVPQTPAVNCGLKVGDVVVTVDGKSVVSLAQANKLIKSTSTCCFRVQRKVNNYVIKEKFLKTEEKTPVKCLNKDEKYQEDFEIVEESVKPKIPEEVLDSGKKSRSFTGLERIKSSDKIPKILTSNSENMSKIAQTIGSFTLRKRKISSSPGDNIPTTTTSSPQHSNSKSNYIPIPSVCITNPRKLSFSESHENSVETETIEILKGQTKDLNTVIKFNDEYSFNLRDTHKYLNVNVWGVTASNNEILLGYVNVPVVQILNEFSCSLLGYSTMTYPFLPPNISTASQNHPLTSHSGFEQVFCYGDIVLSFIWNGETEIKRKNPVASSENDLKKPFVSSTKHDFVRMQFNRTTHCGFCAKKIWLKDAVQCKECTLACHKKCMSKCQMNVPCEPVEKVIEALDSIQPEITMSEPLDDDFVTIESTYHVEAKEENGLKRVNSAKNLSVPEYYGQLQSKSLPQSPQRTPRKQSLVANTNSFLMCPKILEEIQNQNPQQITESILHMVDEILMYPSDESLMDEAKESGMQLYMDIPMEVKVEKINLMVSELKRVLDSTTIEHMEMCKQLSSTESDVEKARLAFLIGQADAKIQGLTVLMLHYCSGLQHTQEKIV
ncbi:PDZ domain-containing protein 8 isoform X2 [Agrilus planipennis]|uniref:PDZ domain-containing protein 8 isoform X2 n=1 Tax=Agrilus planipennis TaxID=224129 RepID=A0A1W4WR49_AGRPL|nr:PDZ domain-containing protein 8 isoform X2 [Agrilus planipennis]